MEPISNRNVLVLSKSNEVSLTRSNIKVAIVLNLYYLNEIERADKYLDNITETIDVYVFSSNGELCTQLKEKYLSKKNVFALEKDNRGRDLSALLVEFRRYLDKYEYICFLHDKKAKHDFLNEDLAFWVKNLWENTVCSEGYINKVLDLLENGGYGLLMPPKPIGKYIDGMYADPWCDDYKNTVKLAEQLGLHIEINRNDTGLVTLGSAFWCRVDALKLILQYDWKYEDFPEEPMPDDGTISHAIERILGFVALDAGYKVGTIMNTDYAAEVVEILQQKMEATYEWLWENEGIKNTYQLSNFDDESSWVKKMFSQSDKVFLYGAGFYGEKYLERLKRWGYEPYAFVVSDGKKNQDTYLGYPVYELSQIDVQSDYGIIVCTNPDLQNVIVDNLQEKGYTNYYKATVV